MPSQEDCTCYRRLRCPKDIGLSNDDKCRFNSSCETECRPVAVERHNNSSPNINQISELLAVGGPKDFTILSIMITIRIIVVGAIAVFLVTVNEAEEKQTETNAKHMLPSSETELVNEAEEKQTETNAKHMLPSSETELDPCASHNQEKKELIRNQNTIERLEYLEKHLLEWISSTNRVIEGLRILATDLNEHYRNVTIAKVSGSAGVLTGGILTTVGIILIPFTFGGSLGLSIAGVSLIAAGSATVGGTTVADSVLSDNRLQEAETSLKKHVSSTQDIKVKCTEISSTLEELGKIEVCFSEWVIFWAKVSGLSEEEDDVKWRKIKRIMMSEHISSPAKLIVGRDTAVGLLLAPLDIYSLVESAIDIHKTTQKISEYILSLADVLEKQCPTSKDSVDMIKQIHDKLIKF